MTRLWVLGVLASVWPLHAADPLADVFARMDNAAATFKGVAANITQTDYTQFVDIRKVTSGTIQLKRNKAGDVRFLLDFSHADPPQIVAFAGSEISMYNSNTGIENVIDVSTKKDAIQQAMILGFGGTSEEIRKIYDVAYAGPDTINGQKSSEIKLRPKTKELQARFEEADLWISDVLGVPVQQKFLHMGGDYNQFSYSNARLTSSLSDKELQLKVPKGVQIKRLGAGKN